MSAAPAITGIHTIGVPVSDQDKALAFYTGTLGLRVRLDVPMGGGGRWIEVGPEGAGPSVALIRASDAAPAGTETGIRFVTGSADAFHAHLTEAGAEPGEVLRWPGVPAMFAFRDPDGNGMELVEQG
jgi:lactoylglutathione lyase